MPKRKSLNEKSESTKSNYIQYWTAKEDEILRRVLSGATNKAIAEAMGLTENRVSFIVTSPIFQAKQTSSQEIINHKFEEKLSSDPVKKILKANKEKAAKKIVEIIDHEKASLKLQKEAALDTLELQGYDKKPKDDHSTNIYVDKSTNKHLHVALKALNIDAELLKQVDVEGVVEEVGAGKNKSESVSSTGKKELLGVLQGDNAE